MPSIYEQIMGPSSRPTITWPYQPTYGRSEYQQALGDWQNMMGQYSQMMGQVTPMVSETAGYYRPGGGYGQGLRQEAQETVKGGLAKDLASMVSTGMSSQFGARGAQTRAGSELSKLYKNIEDTRAQLQLQAMTPYFQMMQQMAQMQQTRPTYGQYFQTGGVLQPKVTYSS
jgi:hypothetical protein